MTSTGGSLLSGAGVAAAGGVPPPVVFCASAGPEIEHATHANNAYADPQRITIPQDDARRLFRPLRFPFGDCRWVIFAGSASIFSRLSESFRRRDLPN